MDFLCRDRDGDRNGLLRFEWIICRCRWWLRIRACWPTFVQLSGDWMSQRDDDILSVFQELSMSYSFACLKARLGHNHIGKDMLTLKVPRQPRTLPFAPLMHRV